MIDEWNGCYDDSWSGLIVPDAFSHPAKFSKGLIHRIYQYAKEQGWVHPGDYVLDPFGGVALGGLEAMVMGLHWTGIELERKFVNLGTRNIALWNQQLKGWPNLGTAFIVQGDSRNLTDVVNDAGIVVSSPPFTDCLHQTEGGMLAPHQRADHGRDESRASVQARSYGNTPGNLANLREGDIGAVISSPPYADSVNSHDHGIDWSKAGPATGNRKRGEGTKHEETLRAQLNYGSQEGQLSAMPEGDVAAIVSSPPYEAILKDSRANPAQNMLDHSADTSKRKVQVSSYSDSEPNLSNSSSDTFWSASREIVQGCHDLLRPGGHAIWVVKAYVKNKAIVDFPGRWKALCESVGFKTVCEHQAMLVKNHGSQVCMNGECEEISTERKSFFRRLAEKKGSPRIDFEMVQCMTK